MRTRICRTNQLKHAGHILFLLLLFHSASCEDVPAPTWLSSQRTGKPDILSRHDSAQLHNAKQRLFAARLLSFTGAAAYLGGTVAQYVGAPSPHESLILPDYVAYAAPVRFLGLHTACIGSSVGRRNTTKVFGDSRDTFRPWIFYGIGYAPWVGSLVAAMATWGNKDAVYAFYGLRVVADALWGTACAMSIIEVEKGNKRLAKATVLTRPILDLKGRIGVSILIKM